MKTCPNCGTLLFDDVMTCTKCGQDIAPKETMDSTVEAEPEINVEEESVAASDLELEEKPVDLKQKSMVAKPNSSESLKEYSDKRKQWLEEQNKIKAELASIMSRVGKRKTSPLLSSGSSLATDMPQGQTSTAAPYSHPVGTTPQLNPLGPSQIDSRGQTEMAIPSVDSSEQTLEQEEDEGLTEFDKKELLRELDDLRNEGYEVSRLEEIIENNPGNAWKAFSEFLDDIEKLNKQRNRLEAFDTAGIQILIDTKKELFSRMNDPDKLHELIEEINEFENQIKVEVAKKQALPAPGPAPGAVEARKAEQIEQYIAAGKDALRIKDYEKALKIFTKTLELDPTNKEIQFFKKKLEAKLGEISTPQPQPGPTPMQQPQIPTQAKVSVPTSTQTASPRPQPSPATPQPVIPQPVANKPMVAAVNPRPATPSKPITPVRPMVAVQPTAVPKPAMQPTGEYVDGQPKKKKKKKKIVSLRQGEGVTQTQPPVGMSPTPKPIVSVQPTINEEAVFEGPKSAAEYEALGFNAYINKDYPKALEFFEKVLELDPSFPNVENLKNECLMRLGRT